MLVIRGHQCKDKDTILQKEWIETNEFNGLAYFNIAGINTRPEYSLFQTNEKYINNFQEKFIINEKEFVVGDISDENFNEIYLEKFYIDIAPNFIYNFLGVKIKKSLLMKHDSNLLIVKYEKIDKSDQQINLELLPFIINKGKQHKSISTILINEKNYIRYIFDNDNSLYFYYLGDNFEIIDEYRGNNHIPGKFIFNLDSPVYLIISDIRLKNVNCEKLFNGEMDYRNNILEKLSVKYELLKNATLSSYNYVKKKKSGINIINTLPKNNFIYNTTLLSLPGLFLTTNRIDEIKELFLYYAKNEKDGIIPEIASDNSLLYDNVYNSFFFIYVIFKYIQYTGDWKFIRMELWELLVEMFSRFTNNNISGVKLDSDKLLFIEKESLHKEYLSWFKITPGKDLLLNIFWYNSVKIIEMLAAKYSHINISSKANEFSLLLKRHFFKKFWNNKYGFLNNGVDIPPADDIDNILQPYQIFALSLPFNDLLRFNQKVRVLDNIKSKLLTPVGLRSLPTDVAVYKDTEGISNYNNAVHPFLLLNYIIGYKETYDKSKSAKKESKYLLGLYEKNIKLKAIGHFPEIFTSLPPYEAKGSSMCMLSLAEYLRVKYEL